MRRAHFEQLRPVCPACRMRQVDSPLSLAGDAVEADGRITAGELRCGEPGCGRSFPLIAGVPILVPEPDAWIAANAHLIMMREDLHWSAMDRIAAASGPDAGVSIVRQQQASYAFDHYGDLTASFDDVGGFPPEETGVRACLGAALDRLPAFSGPALDIGCAVGRTSFDLAAASDDGLVLGIDVNWPLLAIARHVIDSGRVHYPHRLVGMRYEPHDFPVMFPGEERVDFWIADALALPFASDSFAVVTAFNVLDCVPDPARMLAEASRVSQAEGGVALSTPFDWASHATPPQSWLDGPAALDALVEALNQTAAREGRRALHPSAPGVDIDWTVRLHDRATMSYRTRLATFRSH